MKNSQKKCIITISNTPIPIASFLGYPLEQELYQTMPLTDFVQRLLAKRCVTFMNPDDQYLLITGERGVAKDVYLKVGTPEEQEPLVLRDVISYDEVKVFKNNSSFRF